MAEVDPELGPVSILLQGGIALAAVDRRWGGVPVQRWGCKVGILGALAPETPKWSLKNWQSSAGRGPRNRNGGWRENESGP